MEYPELSWLFVFWRMGFYAPEKRKGPLLSINRDQSREDLETFEYGDCLIRRHHGSSNRGGIHIYSLVLMGHI